MKKLIHLSFIVALATFFMCSCSNPQSNRFGDNLTSFGRGISDSASGLWGPPVSKKNEGKKSSATAKSGAKTNSGDSDSNNSPSPSPDATPNQDEDNSLTGQDKPFSP